MAPMTTPAMAPPESDFLDLPFELFLVLALACAEELGASTIVVAVTYMVERLLLDSVTTDTDAVTMVVRERVTDVADTEGEFVAETVELVLEGAAELEVEEEAGEDELG